MTIRDRAYRRDIRNRQIRRKKQICQKALGFDWYFQDGRYSKGKIDCSCWLCKPSSRYHKMSTYKDAVREYIFELEKEECTGTGSSKQVLRKMKNASYYSAGF